AALAGHAHRERGAERRGCATRGGLRLRWDRAHQPWRAAARLLRRPDRGAPGDCGGGRRAGDDPHRQRLSSRHGCDQGPCARRACGHDRPANALRPHRRGSAGRRARARAADRRDRPHARPPRLPLDRGARTAAALWRLDMTEPPALHPPAEFVKAISRIDATALVVGSMVGSGIFIVSADIGRQVGSPGLLLAVWVLAGITTVIGALTYTELAAMFPSAGGQYVYLREGISPLFGYLYGWTLFLVIQTGTIAAVAVAFARFTSVFFPSLSPDVFLGLTLHLPSGPIDVGFSPQRVLAIVTVILLTWVNFRGVRTAAIIQTSLTTLKVASLVGLIVAGLLIGRNAHALAANFGAGFWPAGGLHLGVLPAIGAAMVGALFSMDAWNNVGFAGSELKNPRRDLPFAMVAGVTTVTVLYLLA